MTIEFKPGFYYIGLWNASALAGINTKIMAIAERPLEQNGELADWTVYFRFRHIEDDKVFDSDDRKSWYKYSIKNATESKIIDGIEGTILKTGCINFEFIEILGDYERAMDALTTTQSKYVNIKIEKITR